MNSTMVAMSVIRCARVHRAASKLKLGMAPGGRAVCAPKPAGGPGGGAYAPPGGGGATGGGGAVGAAAGGGEVADATGAPHCGHTREPSAMLVPHCEQNIVVPLASPGIARALAPIRRSVD